MRPWSSTLSSGRGRCVVEPPGSLSLWVVEAVIRGRRGPGTRGGAEGSGGRPPARGVAGVGGAGRPGVAP